MDRAAALLCACLLVTLTAGVYPVAAGPALPSDDYVDRDCRNARTISPGTTVSGTIDHENDADTFRFPVEEGDTVAFRISTDGDAHAFTLSIHMLATQWTGRIKPGGNTRAKGDWNLAVVLNDSARPGFARAFSVADDTMCVTVHDDPPEEGAYPVAWSLRTVRNDVPEWYRTEDRTPTPTTTPEPPSTTATARPANQTPSPTPPTDETVDTDGDGVPDSEDYAPRDARVQAVDDVRVVTSTDTPSSSALGPGFGPVAGLLAVALLALLAGRR